MDTSSFQSGSPVFDRAHLLRYTGEDQDLQVELIGLMREQARNCLRILRAPQDRVAWRTATHTLKGAARGVGAFALADVCETAEELPEASWPGAALAVANAVSETETVLSDVYGVNR